jgi:hypothetical protein
MYLFEMSALGSLKMRSHLCSFKLVWHDTKFHIKFCKNDKDRLWSWSLIGPDRGSLNFLQNLASCHTAFRRRYLDKFVNDKVRYLKLQLVFPKFKKVSKPYA